MFHESVTKKLSLFNMAQYNKSRANQAKNYRQSPSSHSRKMIQSISQMVCFLIVVHSIFVLLMCINRVHCCNKIQSNSPSEIPSINYDMMQQYPQHHQHGLPPPPPPPPPPAFSRMIQPNIIEEDEGSDNELQRRHSAEDFGEVKLE